MVMNRTDVTGIYTMEELVPIVSDLAERYTSRDSSSITYERARQFMEAAIYCIAHFFDAGGEAPMSREIPPAKEAYRLGYEAVIEKVKRIQSKYNELMTFFDYYGNIAYRDTVQKAIPGFFMYYDVRFAPTENIITMDYPVFGLDMELEGIDMIAQYLDAIYEEQCYLQRFPREFIIEELRSFHPKYEKEVINLREIFLMDNDEIRKNSPL